MSIPQNDPQIPAPSETVCPRCGCLGTPTVTAGVGPHYAKASCRHCGAFLRWLSRYSHEERAYRREQYRRQAMRSRPPSAPQLAYLSALSDIGPPPSDMSQASTRIDQLRRGKGGA
jgi:hypothetical protein